MKILPFEPRPCSRVIIDGGTVTASPFPCELGQHRFFVTFECPDGSTICMWDGASRQEALRAAAPLVADGARLIDHTEGHA
ncbi:hypothetical protein [Xanthobacter autotrophicus]|uniref:hypothetical protein n=1 Tax=Xanthobacter autotrophicus TaxID=280 RepID=UPI0037276079